MIKAFCLFLIFFWSLGYSASSHPDTIRITTEKNFIASIQIALQSPDKPLLLSIDDTIALSLNKDLTIPEIVSIRLGPSGLFILNNDTRYLQIKGPFWAPDRMVFSGRGQANIHFYNSHSHTIKPEWWGARANDSLWNNREAFNNAISSLHSDSGVVRVGPGTFYFYGDQQRIIALRSNMTLFMSDSTCLAVRESHIQCWLLSIQNQQNITITGGHLEGGKERNIRSIGIRIHGSTGISISHMRIRNFGIDGIYVRNSPDSSDQIPTDLFINNLECSNNIRHGMTFGSANNLMLTNSTCSFNGPDKVKDGDGIHFEANTETSVFRHILVQNCSTISNAAQGVVIAFNNTKSDSISILVSHHFDNKSKQGLCICNSIEPLHGCITIDTSLFANNSAQGVIISNLDYEKECPKIILTENTIENCQQYSSIMDNARTSAIYITGNSGKRNKTTGPVGNISISDLSVINSGKPGNKYGVVIENGAVSGGFRSVLLGGTMTISHKPGGGPIMIQGRIFPIDALPILYK